MPAEVVLPRRAAPQPQPALYGEGDCGPCVLSGLLGSTVEEVYQRLREGKTEPLSWSEMRQALWRAQAEGELDRLIDEVPHWWVPHSVQIFGTPAWQQTQEWWKYVRMALDAGYYGVCAVNSEGKGPLSEIDHWVLLCGHRSYEVPLAHLEGARRLQQELLVSSSSTLHPTVEWVEVGPFLRERGGFNVLLARPAERRQDDALAPTR